MNQISPAADLIKESDTASFPADVLEASKQVPVLVDFWAPWCGPCRQLGPAIEKVVSAQNGAVKLVKINVDENQALAGQMGVQSIPAVFAFYDGKPVDGFMGALPESEITKFVAKLLETAGAGGDNEMDAQLAKAIEMADQAVGEGQVDQAAQIYQMILQQIPDNADALIGMARCLYEKGELESAQELMQSLSDEVQASEKYQALIKLMELNAQAAELGDAEQLRSQIEADPDDHQLRLDLAILLSAKGDREEAAKTLVESFKRDRDWNEAAARKKLLEFFDMWGPKDPATLKGRRMLSSALFS